MLRCGAMSCRLCLHSHVSRLRRTHQRHTPAAAPPLARNPAAIMAFSLADTLSSLSRRWQRDATKQADLVSARSGGGQSGFALEG